MARAKKDKRVVVNQAYFELIERKATLLDVMTDGDGTTITVAAEQLKELTKITAAWDKVDAGDLNGSEPYEEPSE